MRLERLLRPRSLAVVGASPNSFVGTIALRNSQRLDYEGVLTPISLRHSEVAGLATKTSLVEMENTPDVVLIQVATHRVLEVVREGLGAGVRNFVIPGGGITDSGEEAHALDHGLRELRSTWDFEVVGPNSMGVLDMVSGAAPYVGTVTEHVRRGSVGVVAQSGAVVELVVNAGGRVPVSTLVSAGAGSTTGLADYLDFFCEDPHTTAVIAFIEGFEDPAEFIAAARNLVGAGKQLAVTTVGRSQVAREGVSAHSGKLAPSSRVTEAALKQAGVHLATDLDELLAFGEIFGSGRLPQGNRVHFVTNSGGEANLLADLAHGCGLVLPRMSASAVDSLQKKWPLFTVRNPMDPWGVDDYTLVYPEAIRTAADEDGDILIVAQDQQLASGEHERTLSLHLAQYLAENRREDVLPVFLSPIGQDPDPSVANFCRQHGIAHLRGARPALSVLGKLSAESSSWEESRGATPPIASSLLDRQGNLPEDESLRLLNELGVRVPHQKRASTPCEAAALAEALQGPVVVKAVADDLYHKSEFGLVVVGLHGATAIETAAAQILHNASTLGVKADLLVAEMATGVLDVYIGYKRDAQFGHTLLAGVGGIWTEHLDLVDVHVGLMDQALATKWIHQTRVGEMLATARGGALPTNDLVTALTAVSRIAEHDEHVVAIDVNPVMVGPHGGVAVDAVIQRTTQLGATELSNQ